MKLVSWNCRDAVGQAFVDHVRFYIKHLGMDVFFLFDTQLDLEASKKVVSLFSFCYYEIIPSVGQYGGLILLWNGKNFTFSVLDKHDLYLHISCINLVTHDVCFVTFLYMWPYKESQLSF